MHTHRFSHEPSGVSLRSDAGIAGIRLPSGLSLASNSATTVSLRWEDGKTLSSDALDWSFDLPACGEPAASFRADTADAMLALDAAYDGVPGSTLLASSLQITNRRDSLLDSVEITLLNVEGVPDDWFCTLPFGGGWAIRLADFAEGREVRLRYPVQGCMQWIELFGPEEGITLQTRDSVPWLKDFAITGTQGGIRVTVTHRHLQLSSSDGAFDLPVFAVGAHAGDWQVGAAIYSRWLESVLPERASAPDWLQRSPGWAWVSGKGQYKKKADNLYKDLPERSRDFSACGVECIQLAAWFEHGHDTRYPDYVAGSSLGGEDGLRGAADAIHSAGRRMALYTNGRLFDSLSESAREHPGWKSWAVHAPAGKTLKDSIADEFIGVTTDVPLPEWDREDEVAKEIYGKVTFATMCPSAPGWQDLYASRLAYAAERYAPDGLYLDQVLGAVAVPCFARDHTHERPYQSWEGYHALLGKVRAGVKSHRPEAYLATEGFSDILSRHFDLIQSHNDWPGPCPEGSFRLPEMTRHAVPWLLQANGPIYPDDMEMVRLVHAAASGFDIACFGAPPEGDFGDAVRWVLDTRRHFGPDLYAGPPVRAWVEGFPARRVMAVAGSRLVICCADLRRSSSGDYLIHLDIPAAGLGGEVNWETRDGSGTAPVRAEGVTCAVALPGEDMLIAWAPLGSVNENHASGDYGK